MATAAELLDFAKQRHQAGDLAGADVLYRQVLEVEPARAEALALLALACHQRNDLPQAATWYGRALAVRPGDAESHFRLGMVLMGLFRPDDALGHFRDAARLRPDSPDVWNNLGNVLYLQDRAVEAIPCYREALRLRPNFAEACQNLGNALRENDHMAEGLACYREAVRLRPDNAKSHMNLAASLLETGNTGEAETHLRECLRINPGDPRVLSTLAANDLYSDADLGPDELRSRLADPKLQPEDVAHLHFTIARLLDRAGRYEEAFGHFKESSRIRRDLLRGTKDWFDAAEHSRLVDRLIALFTPEWFQRHLGFGVDGEEPVFIVGMPRSGSSLVEQILSHHPEAAGVGELRDLPRMFEDLAKRTGLTEPFPNSLAGIDPATARTLAEGYLSRIRELAGPAKRITDKQLANFLYLGFIALLFPRARVVHCRRDPLDTCVSAFMQIFRGMSYTLDLEDLGLYHREYERLMAHWRTVRPLPMLEVVYEELVADVETGSRQLVDFCGLPWDERCLRFYENPRTVRTVSKLQVRKPIYNSSVGRWQRYGNQLDPLRKALGLADAACGMGGVLSGPG
jgi:tetratricopeptide (TPR) repeat protein